MKCMMCFAAGIAVLSLGGRALPAQDADQQKPNELERLCREVQQLVQRYYPAATVSLSYDKKSQGEKIHFEYNTQTFLMRFRNKGGEWQAPVEVRGPYVGGIWCDMVLLKGRYAGDAAGAEQGVEEGVTGAGPDFYSRLVAPYSKKLDRHMKVTLRYPGGTPPKFLVQFDALVKSFYTYVPKPGE